MDEQPLDVAVRAEGTALRIDLQGSLDVAHASRFWERVRGAIDAAEGPVRFDLRGVRSFDGAGIGALLEVVRRCEGAGRSLELQGASPQLREVLGHVDWERVRRRPVPERSSESWADRAANRLIQGWVEARAFVALLGETVYWSVLAAARRPGLSWGRVVSELVRVGHTAIPIVSLITFLIGLIMAMQADTQLRAFGASLYIADLVGVSLTRDLGPLLTAILVAGRSGSAFAAEIGTMVVTEEVEALRSMGINPVRFLVAPKIVALAIALPALSLVGDLIGILGGTVMAVGPLGLGLQSYLNHTREALYFSDVTSGLLKSVFFGIAVGLIGCHMGLRVRGGTEGVGAATTASVVVAIFSIIMLDSVFTALFWMFG